MTIQNLVKFSSHRAGLVILRLSILTLYSFFFFFFLQMGLHKNSLSRQLCNWNIMVYQLIYSELVFFPLDLHHTHNGRKGITLFT